MGMLYLAPLSCNISFCLVSRFDWHMGQPITKQSAPASSAPSKSFLTSLLASSGWISIRLPPQQSVLYDQFFTSAPRLFIILSKARGSSGLEASVILGGRTVRQP